MNEMVAEAMANGDYKGSGGAVLLVLNEPVKWWPLQVRWRCCYHLAMVKYWMKSEW